VQRGLRQPVAALLAAAACLASCGAGTNGDPSVRDALHQYLRAVAAADSASVCSLLTSSAQSKLGVAGACPSLLSQALRAEAPADRAHQRALAATARVKRIRVTGAAANVTIESRLDGVMVTSHATLVSAGGQWKVSDPPHETSAGVDHVYRMPSASMSPTLRVGTIVLVDPTAYSRERPALGQLVAFHPPAGADSGMCGNPRQGAGNKQACDKSTSATSTETLLKRIVAGPGDRVAIVNGHVILNGRREPDSYITPCGPAPECNFPTPIVIPARHYFVLGDNRGASDDSRFWGPVRRSQLIGPVVRVLR
jgi:signal peptidase I